MIARLALRYLAVFALVLAALNAVAYVFVGREYAALLQPALQTPEAAQAYAAAMRRVLLTLLAFDLPLLVIVGAAAWLLARASLQPLLAAQKRERDFAADAAHTLRTPLATIASVAQAQGAQAPSPYAQAFATITQAALDASATVGDLLTLARSARADLLACEPLDLGALVGDTVREFTQRANDRGLTVDLQLRSAIVNGDERRLRDLVRNLLDNAVRHARSSVRIESISTSDYAELVVTNDGDPIDPAHRSQIFERFYQGGQHNGAAGLGLAVVQWIAQAHGGTAALREQSEPAFVVSLPLYR